MKKNLFTLSLFALFISTVNAETASIDDSSLQTNQMAQTLLSHQDSVTGVIYEVDEYGQFARIRSTGRAELNIGDQTDIRLALQKAQMRAKASMTKFLTESVTSNEVIENVVNQTNHADNNGSKATRESVETYMEKIQISASTILKGVITTKTDVNKQDKYVEVEVGYSPKTQNVADTINNNLKTDLSSGNNNNASPTMQSGSEGREVKKAKNYDNF